MREMGMFVNNIILFQWLLCFVHKTLAELKIIGYFLTGYTKSQETALDMLQCISGLLFARKMHSAQKGQLPLELQFFPLK